MHRLPSCYCIFHLCGFFHLFQSVTFQFAWCDSPVHESGTREEARQNKEVTILHFKAWEWLERHFQNLRNDSEKCLVLMYHQNSVSVYVYLQDRVRTGPEGRRWVSTKSNPLIGYHLFLSRSKMVNCFSLVPIILFSPSPRTFKQQCT